MTNHKYKAGIVGCGGIANAHMEGYNKINNVEVVAATDPVEMARNGYIDDYNIPNGYETIQEMLDDAQPEIVSVCVWHLLNDPVTVEVAKGKSVMKARIQCINKDGKAGLEKKVSRLPGA